MKRFFSALLLAGLLLLATGMVAPTGQTAGCPAGCCTGPADCPTPACCLRR